MARARRGRGEGSVEQLKSGAWRATISLGHDTEGRRVREHHTAATKQLALEWLRTRHAQLAGQGRTTAPVDLTLAQWVEVWLSDRDAGAYSRLRVRQVLERHLLADPVAQVKLRLLTAQQVRDWLRRRAEAGAKTPVTREAHAHLRSALNEATARELIPVSPAARVRPPRDERPPAPKRTLTEEQLALVLRETADPSYPAWVHLYFLLGVDSGCRPGELVAARWSDLSEDCATFRVARSVESRTATEKRTKTGGAREVILSGRTAEVLRSRRGSPEERILGVEVRPGQTVQDALAPRLKRVRRRTGIGWIYPYCTRHTCATLLLLAGVPLTVVAARLGHSRPSTTLNHYAHAMPHDQQRAATAMGAILGLSHDRPTDEPK